MTRRRRRRRQRRSRRWRPCPAGRTRSTAAWRCCAARWRRGAASPPDHHHPTPTRIARTPPGVGGAASEASDAISDISAERRGATGGDSVVGRRGDFRVDGLQAGRAPWRGRGLRCSVPVSICADYFPICADYFPTAADFFLRPRASPASAADAAFRLFAFSPFSCSDFSRFLLFLFRIPANSRV